jgi:hypothetical protein
MTGGVREGLKRRWLKRGQCTVFIDVGKRRRARTYALPDRGAAKPGGANTTLQIIIFYYYYL